MCVYIYIAEDTTTLILILHYMYHIYQVSKRYKDKYTNADIETLGCDEFESWLDVHNFSCEVCQAFKGTSSGLNHK